MGDEGAWLGVAEQVPRTRSGHSRPFLADGRDPSASIERDRNPKQLLEIVFFLLRKLINELATTIKHGPPFNNLDGH